MDRFTSKLNIEVFPKPDDYCGTIYHYTSAASINPILLRDTAVVFWASRYDCLNDISEGTVPQIRFGEVCDDMRASGQISEAFYELIRDVAPSDTDLFFPSIRRGLRAIKSEYDTYVTSFSESDDALAMWNYYSKGSLYEGINIGVNAETMINSLSLNANEESRAKVQLFKVIYEEDVQRKIISDFIEELHAHYESGDEHAVKYHISTMLNTLKMLFKNSCFKHEKEVRVVVQISKQFKSEVPVKYRSFAGYFIPYIELKFDKSAVRQVTMGPMVGSEQQKALQRAILDEMMTDHGYCDVAAKCSAIPVRY